MLTLSALGMFAFGLYSAIWAIVDLIRGARLELWAEAGIILFGLLLALGAAFVRVRLPGGVAFAIGALLGLQALAVHTAAHIGGGLSPQLIQAAFAAVLIGLAYAGGRLGAA
jgi:hypothetical protein